MNYHGTYRSNNCKVSQINSVRQLLERSGDNPDKMYQLDGTVSFDEESNTVMFCSTATTFNVWTGNYQGDCTEMFLEELTEFLVEPLCVRSVGHEAARHMPDAWQWIARPDGTVTHERLSFQRE